MFTFDATPVKFIGLLILFAWCTIWCIYEVTRRQTGVQRVSNVLHVAMAVVMLAMIAGPIWKGLTAVVPTWGLTVIFVAATLWFIARIPVSRAAGDAAGVKHFAGHSMMFGAMVWHLAAMAVMAAAMSAPAASAEADTDMSGHGDMAGSGSSMGGMDSMSAMQQQGGALWWFAVVGLAFMTYLLVASIVALIRVFDNRGEGMGELAACCAEIRPVGTTKYRLAALSDFAMNFGMFWMSTGLLVPVLPFFAALAF